MTGVRQAPKVVGRTAASTGSGSGSGSGEISRVQVVTPARVFRLPSVTELWQARDLMYLLARRDVSVRYRQTAVGAAWAILQPLLLAAVFSLFFGRYAHIPSGGGVPYPVFALSGMVLWLYFTACFSRIADSTVKEQQMITKVYLPRTIIPLAASIQPLIDFAIAFTILIPITFAYGVVPSWRLVFVPVLVVLTWLVALGPGLLFSALNVKYRDVALVVPFLLMVGMFITPIVYPYALVPHSVRFFYALNPMVGVLETYRWLIFSHAEPPGALIVGPLVFGVVLLVLGGWYFQRTQQEFADVM